MGKAYQELISSLYTNGNYDILDNYLVDGKITGNGITSTLGNTKFKDYVNSLLNNGLSQDQIDKILQGKGFSLSKFAGWIFWINKILLLTTFTEFLFQRFDIVTLFLCIVVILIELEIFTHKHLYIWLAVLVFSFILDAFVLIDIAPVSKNITL